MTITLSSAEEALAYLVQLENDLQPEEIRFEKELSWVHIRVSGERYHATLPGELARGIWQFQEAIYSAAAFALTGAGDIRKLTSEQRSSLELVFEVSEGSTDLWAACSGFLDKLGEGFKDMDALSKARTIIVVALIVAAGWGFGKSADVFGDIRKEEVKAEQIVAIEQQQTKQLEVFAKALIQSSVAQKFDQAVTEGTRSIARAAHDATSIEVGRTVIDSEGIQELNKRAPRVSTVADVLNLEFRIFKVDVREPGLAKYVLAGKGTGEFVAAINENNFTNEELAKVLDAAQKRLPIRLEVVIARSKGEIKSAEIMQVF